MCYIAFISYSLHWRYIKTALQEYVMITFITISWLEVFFILENWSKSLKVDQIFLSGEFFQSLNFGYDK